MKCKYCNLEISGKRVYCDDKCRMAFNRLLKPNTQPEQVESEHEPEQPVSRSKFNDILHSLPPNVVEPTCLPTTLTGDMSGSRLRGRLRGMRDWQGSSEYAEVCYRLLTCDEAELREQGMDVPVWKVAV